MKTMMLFFGPGIRYVPHNVGNSWGFWAMIGLLVVVILLYHNGFFRRLFYRKGAGPSITYSADGRSGYVWYAGAEADFSLYYEFGGGDCVACIEAPEADRWEQHTGLPLARREAVLAEIGRQVVIDQTVGGKGSFKLEGGFLCIYA